MFFAAPVLSYLARPKRRGQPFIAMADYKNSKRRISTKKIHTIALLNSFSKALILADPTYNEKLSNC
jgi:hypothetical protein